MRSGLSEPAFPLLNAHRHSPVQVLRDLAVYDKLHDCDRVDISTSDFSGTIMSGSERVKQHLRRWQVDAKSSKSGMGSPAEPFLLRRSLVRIGAAG